MAEYTGYISIRQILDDLLAHPLLRGLSLERAVDYAVHFIRIVGMPKITTEKTETVKIDNYRALLPDDYYAIIKVLNHKNNTPLVHSSTGDTDNSYKIQGNIIYSSLREGELTVSYKALLVDEDGYPMIPDNSSFIKALELYIKKQYFTILFDLGKINIQVLNNTQQEYAWYVGQCQSDLVRPTLDEMKSITNMWNNIIINKKHS
jgi:hypothetical protein